MGETSNRLRFVGSLGTNLIQSKCASIHLQYPITLFACTEISLFSSGRQLNFNERLATYYKIPPSLKDKPEWTFGFKMAGTDDDRISRSSRQPDYSGTFHSRVFEEIGLHAYYHWPPSEGLCFPWGVVQADDDFTHCKSQALFDVTFALSILRHLYKRCGRAIEETPPVVFFTCSRPTVSVWIAWLFADVDRGAVLVGSQYSSSILSVSNNVSRTGLASGKLGSILFGGCLRFKRLLKI